MNKEENKELVLDISAKNIIFLSKLDNNSYDGWGTRFDLKRGQVSTYVNKKAMMPTHRVLAVCKHYGISMEDFYSKELTNADVHRDSGSVESDPSVDYGHMPDFSNGLTKEKATDLYRQLLKERKKVKILTETLRSI